jgi:hypothetical protein
LEGEKVWKFFGRVNDVLVNLEGMGEVQDERQPGLMLMCALPPLLGGTFLRSIFAVRRSRRMSSTQNASAPSISWSIEPSGWAIEQEEGMLSTYRRVNALENVEKPKLENTVSSWMSWRGCQKI